MPLDNCQRCGSLFNRVTRKICETCFEEEEELLRITQRYLRDNRGVSMARLLVDLSEQGHEVDKSLIEKWVKEKRLDFKFEAELLKGVPHCPYCNRELKEGEKMCKTCQLKRLAKSSEASTAAQPKNSLSSLSGKGMYYKKRS